MSEKRKKPYGYSEMTEKKKIGSNLLLALTGFVFLSCFAVVFVLHFRWLYYADVEYLGLSELTGLSSSVIRENYDVLIDYNSMFYQGELEFPTFSMSESGRIHFQEVKRLFSYFQYLLIVTFLICGPILLVNIRKRSFAFLKAAGAVTLVLPSLIAVFIAFNWDWVFVTFHKIAFRNDYWIFDPKYDSVITILPDRFFMHCALLIVLLVVLGAVLCLSVGFFADRKKYRF